MTHSRKLVFGWYDYAVFLCYFVYASGSIVLPIALVSLARELKFSLEEGGFSAGGALSLGRAGMILIFMLLCGFMAGRWGKRRVFGISLILTAIGLGLSALASDYAILFFALMVTGIGEGAIEGLATPFVQDLHPDQPGRYLNFAHAFWPIGLLFTVLLFGWLLSVGVSWRLMMASVAIAAILPAAMLLVPRKTHPYPEHPEPLHWSVVHNQAMTILRIRRFWLFFAAMFVAGGGEICLTFWSASYIQLHFSSSAWSGAVGTAVFAAGMISGRTLWAYFIRQHQLSRLVVISAIGGTLITLCFPALNHLGLFFVLLFLAGFATAPFWPSIQSYCTDCLPEADKTMIFILLSCSGIPGCAFFTWLMGYIGNLSGSLSLAFYLVPACYLLLALMIGIDGMIHGPFRQQKLSAVLCRD